MAEAHLPAQTAPPEPAQPLPACAAGQPGLYVYYRVPLAHLAQTVVAVHAMQQALCAAWPGLQAELLRRADLPAAAADTTLMETYRSGDLAALQTALAVAAAALPQPRHNEVFEPVPLDTPRQA